MPRTRPNSQVKELPDLALLATAQPIDAMRLRAALEQTFTFRKTHALPASVPVPIEAWRTSSEVMARDDQLAWRARSGEEGGAGGEGLVCLRQPLSQRRLSSAHSRRSWSSTFRSKSGHMTKLSNFSAPLK